MEAGEAIKLVDDRMCYGRGQWSQHHQPENDMYWQAGEAAISALRRLEPKQPIWREIEITNDGGPIKNAFCPICEAEYEPDDIDRIGFDYCYSCGQALKWEGDHDA